MNSCVTGGELIGADLHFGLVDRVFLIALPELVNPAEAVFGCEDFSGQAGKLLLQASGAFQEAEPNQEQDRPAERLRAASVCANEAAIDNQSAFCSRASSLTSSNDIGSP